MTKVKGNEKMKRAVSMDISDELQHELRARGILLLDGDEIDGMESGAFYRDLFWLAMSGWPKEKPIWTILNSPGGSVYQGFAICDAIGSFVEQGYTMNVCGIGYVASAAAAIISKASPGGRYALPTTQFLLHEVSDDLPGREDTTQTEERAAEKKRINGIICSIVADRAGMEHGEFLAKVRKTNFWMGAEDAKKFGKNGLIDEICTTFPFMDVLQKKD